MPLRDDAPMYKKTPYNTGIGMNYRQNRSFQSHKAYAYKKVMGFTNYRSNVTDLQDRSHKDGGAHEDEDHESGEALLSDSQKLGLLSRRWALGLQLQAVHVCDGEDGGSHEPWQAHNWTHSKHHTHHKQVQVIATTFLQINPQCTQMSNIIIQIPAKSNKTFRFKFLFAAYSQ